MMCSFELSGFGGFEGAGSGVNDEEEGQSLPTGHWSFPSGCNF